MEFKAFPKIPRWSKVAQVVITEKIDGTNACVVVSAEGEVTAQSRTRMITPAQDNYGFAAWVEQNAADLRALGPGYHFGEWWGRGIQRGYGLNHRRFSLFNTGRWLTAADRPACCDVVPLIGVVPLETLDSAALIANLLKSGSWAAPGFMQPEGLCFWLGATGHHFKRLCENDDTHKGALPTSTV
jgi:hypothetical protein